MNELHAENADWNDKNIYLISVLVIRLLIAFLKIVFKYNFDECQLVTLFLKWAFPNTEWICVTCATVAKLKRY